jgi:hypothetical protein
VLSLDDVRERAQRNLLDVAVVEIDRYLLPGDSVPFIDLRLSANQDVG